MASTLPQLPAQQVEARHRHHKVVLAGGSGQLGQTIIDSLVARGKHDIVILSRRDAAPEEIPKGAAWLKVDYQNKSSLVEALKGAHTVLSFIIVHTDPDDVAQRNLIDACVEANVKRFAPSEWSAADVSLLPWYAGKARIREYLKNLNKDRKVLEYTLFQPGMMLDYYTFPHIWHKHIKPLQIPIDFGTRRAIILDGVKDAITFTRVRDVVHVVAKALEYKGEWPVIGGIRANTPISSAQLIALGEQLRGKPFALEKLRLDDLERGEVKSSWIPQPNHASLGNMTQEERDAFGRVITRGVLLSFGTRAFSVSAEWNNIFPDIRFGRVDQFLYEFWTLRE
ncbi:hypothetical protein MFIFM68171_08939 [Madurella fahalii]|uniref:NmrA-like domain-containing protein n=1 Tax=Madurella fahalii TaxID=1157608 RepID=A0ABQ0GLU8_9PEZI